MLEFNKDIYGKPTYVGTVPGSVGMKLYVYRTKEEASIAGSNIIIGLAKKAHENQKPITMIIPTGNSPIPTYRICSDEYNFGNVSFQYVNFRNMDEYEGCTKYQDFTKHHIIDAIDKNSYDIFNGKAEDPEAECERYENNIDTENLELLFGGTGEEGHLAFNEAAPSLQTKCHRETLSDNTKSANAFDYPDGNFPDHALTIGLGLMFKAKKAMIYAFGPKKATAVEKAVSGYIDPQAPISFMQLMQDADLIMDEAAAAPLIKSGMVKPV
ncbi:MAG: 6-phosphogluconolactonase [Oscillospiraceae bacterium]|nr:6-phosphogluconolactonase [Oscillospiraceae bacterium]